MRLFILCLYLLMCCFHDAPAQVAGFYYTRFGGADDDAGSSIVQARNRDFLVVGTTGGFGAMQNDIYLARTDSVHQVKWQRSLGGFLSETGKDVQELPDSSIVIAGSTNSWGNGGYDILVIRTDKNGNLIWKTTVGGADWDFGTRIRVMSDTTLVISGYTYSYGRKKQGMIVALKPDGSFKWQKVTGGAGDDVFNNLTVTSKNDIVAIGTTKSYRDTTGDIWLFRCNGNGDSTGTFFVGGFKKETGNAIFEDKQGNFIIAGGSETYSRGKSDVYIAKLDKHLNFIWQVNHGEIALDEEAWDVKPATSSWGGMIVCYSTRENVAFGLDSKTLLLNASGIYIDGGRVGSYGEDEVFTIANCHDHGFALVGYTTSFDALLKDVFVLRFDSLVKGSGTLVLGSVRPKEENPEIRIWSDPVSGKITIASKEIPDHLEIRDISGRTLQYEVITPAEGHELRFQGLPGVYLVDCTFSGRRVVKKIIR